MITKNEISSLNLSPTKKDFVQIWNELIEVASKITERWDPTSTNESDPGIVLLKVLAGIADKLNYNIDKNILEAFMPTAAQMESMRKLCELVGYDIKYYQSAETKVRISYTGNTTDRSDDNDERLPEGGLALPKFTTITNADKDITFVTTNAVSALFHNESPWVEVSCIEGQLSQCESINENNLITLAQLDSNNRYYLPEIQIAENGIFVYNAATNTGELSDGVAWEQVSNLNTQPSNSRVFKFGYDSFEGRPYLVFPEDVGSLIGDGLFIYFIRTSGLSGNISPRTLEVLELPTGGEWENYSAEQFEVVNVDATTNGANIESISTAYNNFKKTVGTFDTLVTCRDYMNKIYSLMDANNLPYVSNILVTDIRNDINNAYTLCSCNEYGILYKETPITKLSDINVIEGYPVKSALIPAIVDGKQVPRLALELNDNSDSNAEVPVMDHFDLVLYPFKTFTQVSSSTTDLVEPYNKSFTYTEQMNNDIEASLEDFKTCAHNLVVPKINDIVTINNYLKLNALIATSTKVSAIETEAILQNVKVALVNEFNLRNLDFGEEIPFDSILSVIENADSRIKAVSLQEPAVLTTYSVKELGDDGLPTSKEYGIASQAEISAKDKKVLIGGVDYTDDCRTAKAIYNKLVLRNILAGRASLFDYDETFIPNNSEKPYTITKDITETLATNIASAKGKAEEELSADEKTAKKIQEAIDGLLASSSAGEHILSVKSGFWSSDSVLTLRVSEPVTNTDSATVSSSGNSEVGEASATTKDYKLYETYRHTFSNTSAVQSDAALFARTRNSVGQANSDIISDITQIKAVCELKSDSAEFKNVTLAKNEVIKFRAPNLITTQTFPAYVYYHFEHNDSPGSDGEGVESVSKYGSYAKAMSLKAFISQDSVGIEKFFSKLWDRTDLATFTASLNTGKLSFGDAVNLSDIFNKALAVGTETTLQVAATYKKDDHGNIEIDANGNKVPETYKDYESKVFIKESELTRVLNEHFTQANPQPPTVTFKYYLLEHGTMGTWSSCVESFNPQVVKGETLGYALWKLSSTSSYSRGRLVLSSGKKLLEQDGNTLSTGAVGDTTYICTYAGYNSDLTTISEASEVELRANDKLYIHYTPSSTNEDGETEKAEPVSIVYSGSDDNPVIIKPSGFTLMPSEDVVRSQGISWKKTGVDFNGTTRNLLALAPNEQIEMRGLSQVVLNTPAMFYKNFDNEGLEKGSIINYELKDGEYIFYTDQNTQEAAYYGSGSVITLTGGARIPKTTEKVEVSQILEQGLHVVPWGSIVSLNDTNTVTITEYQYITLTEGDTLKTLTINADSTPGGKYTINNSWTKCLSTIDNPVRYTIVDTETPQELPKIDLLSGPTTGWEVCSLLELSTSPGYSQTLRATEADSSSGETSANVSITNKIEVFINKGTDTEAITITPQKTATPDGEEVFEPVSIKLDTIAQVASGEFKAPESTEDDEDFEDTTSVPTLQLKVFKEEPPAIIALTSVDEVITPISNKQADSMSIDANLTRLNNYWTKIDVKSTLLDFNNSESGTPSPKAVNLNFMIPENDLFGIFSIYLDVPDYTATSKKDKIPEEGCRVFIDIPGEFSSYEDVISIFNYYDETSQNSWWSEGVANGNRRVYLKAGLNCIKITKSCNLLIKAENSAVGNIIYDNLRLVRGKETNGINLALLDPDMQYLKAVAAEKEIDKVAMANNILDGIKELDKNHEFYYNTPIENSLAIEFDNNINAFSNPYTLYDINNINNSFVVSKLDVKYLDTGLKIAKSSKY